MKKALSALLALLLVATATGCGSSPEPTAEATQETQAVTTEAPTPAPATLDEAFQEMQDETAGTDEASSARVDQIAMIAKADAENMTDDLGNEACVFIIENFPDFYTDNVTMEKVMYCGYLLEYGYKDQNAGKLGQDTVQAVKYVYRGAEGVDDEATQENLRQIKELLDNQLG